MNGKQEILKKYKMFLAIKKMIVVLGVLGSLSLTGYFILSSENSILRLSLMSLSIVSIILFLVLWISIRPIKKHILDIIKIYHK